MIPSSRRVAQSALFALSLALLASCASGPQFYANAPPVDMSPAAIMARGTCTDLPVDKDGSINPVSPWIKLTPAQMTCGGKYASGAYRCADPAKCPALIYSVTFGEKDRGKVVRLVADGMGDFEACAEPVFRFGWRGGIDCKRESFSGAAVRAVLGATVPPLNPGGGEQTATSMQLTIWPKGTGPVTIGQIGFVDSPTP